MATKREKVFSNVLLRSAARAFVHLQPYRLGSVSEGYLGTFGMRPFGLPLQYELGPRDSVGNFLLWCGPRHFEPATLPLFHRMARTARVVLDIGANTGFFSLLACAANPSCRVIAWEPVPYLCDKLRVNVRLNKFAERCEVRQVALSDHSGRASLYVPGDTTMASLEASFNDTSVEPIEVEVATVDTTLPADLPVDLIKLDVESHEYQALCGMRGLLARHRPRVIFECLPGTPSEPIERLLRDLGYTIFQLTGSGPVQVKHIAGDAHSRNHNFLATTGGLV